MELINEFLQFHSLGYSQSVFLSESNLQDPATRFTLQNKLALDSPSMATPLLVTLVQSVMKSSDPSEGRRQPEREAKKEESNVMKPLEGGDSPKEIGSSKPEPKQPSPVQ